MPEYWCHCWFSKMHSEFNRSIYETNPVYRLQDGSEVEITCAVLDSGNYEQDRESTERFLFPDSVYLGVGIAIKSAQPLKPISFLTPNSSALDAMMKMTELRVMARKHESAVRRAKAELN